MFEHNEYDRIPEDMTERVVKYPGGIRKETFLKSKKEKSVGGTIFGIAFMAWFILSIIFMISNFTTRPAIGVATCGQIFLGFGVVFLCSKMIIGAVPAIVGAAMVTGGLMFHFGEPELQEVILYKALPIAGCSIFALAGIIMLIFAYKGSLKKKRCSTLAIAQCAQVNKEVVMITERIGDSSRDVPRDMWVSYFKYYFNGEYYYCDCEAVPANQEKPSSDVTKDVYINPDNPQEYIEEATSKLAGRILLILGSVFTFMGVCATCIFGFVMTIL